MNNRVITILSSIIIVIGIIGILKNHNPQNPTDPLPITIPTQSIKQNRTILAAKTLKPLPAKTIINVNDYELLSIEYSDNDIKHDLSSILKNNSLQGFLVENNLKKGEYISYKTILAPDSPKFISHAINEDEMIYTYRLNERNKQNIINSFKIGELVDLYIKIPTVTNNTYTQDSERDGDVSSNVSLNSSYLSLLVESVTILKIPTININNNDASNEQIGKDEVILKIPMHQYSKLMNVDKPSEFIVMLKSGTFIANHSTKNKKITSIRGIP